MRFRWFKKKKIFIESVRKIGSRHLVSVTQAINVAIIEVILTNLNFLGILKHAEKKSGGILAPFFGRILVTFSKINFSACVFIWC